MAKSIKAIKCPQCGSTQKKEVREDFFRCESCGTEYFLDNDDININYTERKIGPTTAAMPKRPGLIAAIVLGVLVLLFVLPRLFYSSSSTYGTSSGGGSAMTSDDDDAPLSNKYRWKSTQENLYLNAKRQPVLFVVGSRSYEASRSQRFSQANRDSCFATFYDASTGKELKSVPLSELNAKKSVDLDLKFFENGDLYVVANKTSIYKVDKAAYTLTDVTKTLFQEQQELGYGVASIQPVGEDKGDGFSLFTNDGRTVFYYPRIRKVYNKDAYREASGGMRSLLPNSATKTTFAFTIQTVFDYSEDKLQLIKYTYRNNDGGPKEAPMFGWEKYYGGAGVYTGADLYKKVLITPRALQRARMLSFDDFTPGRLYFSPEVLYSDAEQVLIRFRPTAADGSAPVTQLLDAKTGAIKFTTPIPEGFDAEQAVRYADGFALRDDRNIFLLGPDGKFSKPVALP